MKVKGLNIPTDVDVELLVHGEVNFSFYSVEGKDAVTRMGEMEKLKFAIAVIAKKRLL